MTEQAVLTLLVVLLLAEATCNGWAAPKSKAAQTPPSSKPDDPMSQSVRLFCRDGRHFDLRFEGGLQKGGILEAHPQPCTDDDFRIATSVFSKFGRKLNGAQDEIDRPINGRDGQDAINCLRFDPTWLDYLQHLRLGHLIALQVASPSDLMPSAESIASQRTCFPAPSDKQGA